MRTHPNFSRNYIARTTHSKKCWARPRAVPGRVSSTQRCWYLPGTRGRDRAASERLHSRPSSRTRGVAAVSSSSSAPERGRPRVRRVRMCVLGEPNGSVRRSVCPVREGLERHQRRTLLESGRSVGLGLRYWLASSEGYRSERRIHVSVL